MMPYLPRIRGGVCTFFVCFLLLVGYAACYSLIATQTVLPSVFFLFLQQSILAHGLPVILGAGLLCGLVGILVWAWSTVFFLKRAAMQAFRASHDTGDYAAFLRFFYINTRTLDSSAGRCRARICALIGIEQQSMLSDSDLHDLFVRHLNVQGVVLPQAVLHDMTCCLWDAENLRVDPHSSSSDRTTEVRFQSVVRDLLAYHRVSNVHATWLLKAWLFTIDWVKRHAATPHQRGVVCVFVELLCGDNALSLEEWQQWLSMYIDQDGENEESEQFFGQRLKVLARLQWALSLPVCEAALSRGRDYYDALRASMSRFNAIVTHNMGPGFFPASATDVRLDVPTHDYARFPVFLDAFLRQLMQSDLDALAIAEQFKSGTAFFWEGTSVSFRVALFSTPPSSARVPGALTSLLKAVSGDSISACLLVIDRLFSGMTNRQRHRIFLANLGVLSTLLGQCEAGKGHTEVVDGLIKVMLGEQYVRREKIQRIAFLGGDNGVLVQLARQEVVFDIDGQMDSPLMRIFASGAIKPVYYSFSDQCVLVTQAFVHALVGVGPEPSLLLSTLNETQWVGLLTRLFIHYPYHYNEGG